MAEDGQRRRREQAARQFWDVLAVTTEHQDVTKLQAFREMCEAAIAVYCGTEDQYVADWARGALRLLDEREPRYPNPNRQCRTSPPDEPTRSAPASPFRRRSSRQVDRRPTTACQRRGAARRG